MRLTPELLNTVEGFAGAGSTESMNDIPFIVLTPVSNTEFNLKFMSEDQMFAEFKDDANLQIIS